MISVIIPIYNQANKLERCLKSILRQQDIDLEVIAVDDGSHDHLELVIEKMRPDFGGKLIFIQQENHGAPSARNAGLRAAHGEYLFFCDADVNLRDGIFKKMLEALNNHPEASYVYCDFKFGWKKFVFFPFSSELLKKMPYISPMALSRRADFPRNGWDESIKKFQDWDIYLTMLENGKIGYWLNEILFDVTNDGSISNWLPSFFYKIFPFLPQVKKYKNAKKIIKQKHNLR